MREKAFIRVIRHLPTLSNSSARLYLKLLEP
jgi:hypothetical protein